MNMVDTCELMQMYAKCPKCGCETVGGGDGTLECDTAAGYFKRTCRCGWSVGGKERLATTGQS